MKWVDLPYVSHIEPYCHQDMPLTLKNCLKAYEERVKDDVAELQNRILLLTEISQLVNDVLASLPVNSQDLFLYQNLLTISTNKKNYLEKLHALTDDKTIEESFSSYFYNNQMLSMSNTTYFDVEKKELWGKYWVEAIDPCHRYLTPWYETWLKQREKMGAPAFFFWLESQEVPANISYIDFIEAPRLSDYEIHIEQGQLWRQGRRLITNPKQENVFIIDANMRIYLAEASSTIRHPSLSHGKPILGAGSIQVHEGTLTQLILGSGHYLPHVTENQQTLRILLEKGLHIPKNMEIFYYIKFKRVRCFMKDFLHFELKQSKAVNY